MQKQILSSKVAKNCLGWKTYKICQIFLFQSHASKILPNPK